MKLGPMFWFFLGVLAVCSYMSLMRASEKRDAAFFEPKLKEIERAFEGRLQLMTVRQEGGELSCLRAGISQMCVFKAGK